MDTNVPKLPYLHQRPDGSAWVFRAAIPAKYRELAGQTEFKETLAPSLAEALALYPAFLQEWNNLRERLKAEYASTMGEEVAQAIERLSIPTHAIKHLGDKERAQLKHFTETWRYRSLENHQFEVQSREDDELDEYQAELEQRQQEVRGALRRMTPPEWWSEEMNDNLGEAMGFTLHEACAEREPFLLALLGEESKALDEALRRLNGEYIATPAPPPAPELSPEPAPPPIKTTLAEVFAMWDGLKNRNTKTVTEYRNYLTHFAQFALGSKFLDLEHSSLSLVTKKNVEAWLTYVAKEQQVERPTLRKYRSALCTLIGVAAAKDKLDFNPVEAVKLSILELKNTKAQVRKNKKESRYPFTYEQLEQYFSGPLFQSMSFSEHLPPAVAYWFPVLLRFSGARPLEISYLMRDDIVKDDGGWWIYIFNDDATAPDGLPRPTKTGVSLRRIPVSEHLIALGFEEYVTTVAKGQWLFPMPVGGEDKENRARYALKHLGLYLRNTLNIKDKELVTYSFRHTAKDEARLAKVPTAHQDALLGHAIGDQRDKNAGELVYGHKWYPAQLLREAMAQLDTVMVKPQGLPSWAEYLQRP